MYFFFEMPSWKKIYKYSPKRQTKQQIYALLYLKRKLILNSSENMQLRLSTDNGPLKKKNEAIVTRLCNLRANLQLN